MRSTERTRLVSTFSDMAAAGARMELRPGIINKTPDPHFDPGPYTWQVTCGGTVVQATWAKGVSPYDGAPCTLALATVNGTTTYTVIAVPSQQPNMSGMYYVSAFTAGQGSVTVQKSGQTYTAHRSALYTPAAGDFCLCLDYEGQLYAVCSLASYVQPVPFQVPQVAPTPPDSSTSDSLIPAQDSGTWTASFGGWNAYYKQAVATGSGNIPVSTGAWFYNGGTAALANRTITRLQFWVPARIASGTDGSEVGINLYAHSSQSRGTTEPTRVGSSFFMNVPPGWAGGYVDLPLSFAPTIQGGGGVSIAGDPYIVFAGTGTDGNSGALWADWSTP